MKIGIFSPYLSSLAGGEKYMLGIAECLSHHHQVDIFWDPAERDVIKKQTKERLGIDLSKITFSENIFARNYSFFNRFFQSRSYDFIVVLSDGSIPFVGSKLIIHFQSPMEWVDGTSWKTKIKISRVHKVICNSEYTKKYIDRTFGMKSDVIYPPATILREKIEGKENIILNVGRFGINWAGSSFKKQEVLIDVFKKMVDEGFKNWKLFLVVSVTEEHKGEFEELKKSSKKYPIEFFENLSSLQLETIYKRSKIYWHAAGFGEDLERFPDRAEHFGIATVEAMSAEAVPIVINSGGQNEIVEDGKSGFLWNTILELQEITKRVSKDQRLWKKISCEASQRAKKFDKKTFCEGVNKILHEIS